jgi:hypothetical protein
MMSVHEMWFETINVEPACHGLAQHSDRAEKGRADPVEDPGDAVPPRQPEPRRKHLIRDGQDQVGHHHEQQKGDAEDHFLRSSLSSGTA